MTRDKLLELLECENCQESLVGNAREVCTTTVWYTLDLESELEPYPYGSETDASYDRDCFYECTHCDDTVPDRQALIIRGLVNGDDPATIQLEIEAYDATAAA